MATMTQTRTAAQGMCRRVSSPAAAAAVQELVGKGVAATGRKSASPREGDGKGARVPFKTEIGVDITRRSSDESNDGSHSAMSQRATPNAYLGLQEQSVGGSGGEAEKDVGAAFRGGAHARFLQQRVPVPDGPVYSALQRELSSNAKSNDAHDPTDPPGALMGAGAEAAAASRPPSGDEGQWLAQQQHVNSLEALLDDAKMSNRLLSRALSAVQQRLKHVEIEKEQFRRERDFFRQMALRFPFSLSHAPATNPE